MFITVADLEKEKNRNINSNHAGIFLCAGRPPDKCIIGEKKIISQPKHVVGTQKNRLITQNICID